MLRPLPGCVERDARWRRQVFESLAPEEREPAARLLGRLSEIMEQQL